MRHRALAIVLLWLGSVPGVSFAQTHIDPNKTPALYGSGFDSIGSAILGDCVRRDVGLDTIIPKPNPSTNPTVAVRNAKTNEGQAVTYTASEVTSLQKFRQITNISASASFSYGIYSGGGSYNFFDDESLNSFSSYLYISVAVDNQTDVLSKKLLTDAAKAALVQGPGPFRTMCGDQFLSALTTGGTFSVVVKFDTSSAEHQRQVSAAINGAIGGFGSASGSFSQSLATLSQLAHASILIVRKGDAGSIPALPQLNEYALSFPEKVGKTTGKPWAFDAAMLPYAVIENKPSGTVPEVYDHQQIYLEGLATLRDSALQKRNDLKYAIAHADEFNAADVTAATAGLSAQNTFLDSILDLATKCKVDPLSKCVGSYPTPPSVVSPARISSPAGKSLDQIEKLYQKRGNRSLVIAALALMDNIDLTGATNDERYYAELLRSELLAWKLNPGAYIGGSSNPDYKSDSIQLSQAIARASGLANLLTSRPCESEYLGAQFNIRQDPAGDAANYRRQLAAVKALKGHFTREGKACETYDFSGIAATSAYIEIRLADMKGVPDAAQLRAAALSDAADAAAGAPDWPLNFWVSNVLKAKDQRCASAIAFITKPTPADYVPLEPEYTNAKKAILLGLALDCPAK